MVADYRLVVDICQVARLYLTGINRENFWREKAETKTNTKNNVRLSKLRK